MSERELWEPTGEMRFVVPNTTTTDAEKLQQAFRNRETGQIEWRKVPRVVIPFRDFYGV